MDGKLLVTLAAVTLAIAATLFWGPWFLMLGLGSLGWSVSFGQALGGWWALAFAFGPLLGARIERK